jgi:hypothetical protein
MIDRFRPKSDAGHQIPLSQYHETAAASSVLVASREPPSSADQAASSPSAASLLFLGIPESPDHHPIAHAKYAGRALQVFIIRLSRNFGWCAMALRAIGKVYLRGRIVQTYSHESNDRWITHGGTGSGTCGTIGPGGEGRPGVGRGFGSQTPIMPPGTCCASSTVNTTGWSGELQCSSLALYFDIVFISFWQMVRPLRPHPFDENFKLAGVRAEPARTLMSWLPLTASPTLLPITATG